jgi:ribose 5-phosphate isomerase B
MRNASDVNPLFVQRRNDLFTAQKSREHNNANVLVFGSRVIGEDVAKEIVRVWLSTPYGGGRHDLRNARIGLVEQQYTRSGR